MKKTLALVAVVGLCLPAAGQNAPKKTPPPSSGGVSISTGSAPPPGAKPAEIQDVRLLSKESDDPYEYEHYGLSAFRANDMAHARMFFEKSWKYGQLPTAAYNLACVDLKEGKTEAAFTELERAVSVGYDDEATLLNDADIAPIRGQARFSGIVAKARKNRAAGDAAVVKEGTFIAPQGRPVGILVLLHDKSSDPLAVSNPFLEAARARGLFVAVPRGPAREGHNRFGWGDPVRAVAAVNAAIAEAKKRTANPQLPVFAVGVGFGGTLALRVGGAKVGTFVGVGSIAGPVDLGGANPAQAQAVVAGLRGARLFLGVPADAPHGLVAEMARGVDALRGFGFQPVFQNWPGAGATFPKDIARAVKETLDGVTGTGAR